MVSKGRQVRSTELVRCPPYQESEVITEVVVTATQSRNNGDSVANHSKKVYVVLMSQPKYE